MAVRRLRRWWGGLVLAMVGTLAGVMAGAAGLHAGTGAAATEGPRDLLLRATTEGAVQGGMAGGAVRVWHGIPYAAPPVGEGRWRPPRPPVPRAQVLDARQPDPQQRCAQAALTGDDAIHGGEDCLTLNIWAPLDAAPGSRPVMVWIHGGANVRGGAADYDARALAARGDVVVVTVNYRLGVLGWFYHPLLAKDEREPVANFGTLDQVAALRWLQSNIAAFGGDPERITIFGESAGGDNVLALLVSPPARGLFHRAIIQSGSVRSVGPEWASAPHGEGRAGSPMSSTELIAQLLLAEGKAQSRAEALRQIGARGPALAPWLRELPAQAILAAATALTASAPEGSGPGLPPVLIEDGVVIPEGGMAEALQQGRFAPVPVMIGATRDEFTILLPFLARETTFFETSPQGWPRVTDARRYRLAAGLLSERFWHASVVEPAGLLASRVPVYVYRFDWDRLLPAPWLNGLELGATHGLDVGFLFDPRSLGMDYIQMALLGPESEPSFRRLSSAMMARWAGFAERGVPEPRLEGPRGDEPLEWPAWRDDERSVMHLDDPMVVRAVKERQQEKQKKKQEEACAFLREVSELGKGVGLADAVAGSELRQVCP